MRPQVVFTKASTKAVGIMFPSWYQCCWVDVSFLFPLLFVVSWAHSVGSYIGRWDHN